MEKNHPRTQPDSNCIFSHLKVEDARFANYERGCGTWRLNDFDGKCVGKNTLNLSSYGNTCASHQFLEKYLRTKPLSI